MVWNGTGWVKYEIKRLNESIIQLKTPACGYIVNESHVLLLDPNCTSLRGGMSWDAEKYSAQLNKWNLQSEFVSNIGFNQTHVWQKWVFANGDERALYIGYDNKQTVILKSKNSGTYRFLWSFLIFNVTKITFSNGEHVKLELNTTNVVKMQFYRVTLWSQGNHSLTVRYHDIHQEYYQDAHFVSAGNETIDMKLTYGNWTMQQDETKVIDPQTFTLECEAYLDGWMRRTDIDYPPNENYTYVYTNSSLIRVGQRHTAGVYHIFRGYVSFYTAPFWYFGGPFHDANITDIILKLKTKENHSEVDFNLTVMGTIYANYQGIYNGSLEINDWNCGPDEIARWSSEDYPGDNHYINITIPCDYFWGLAYRTQFELKSEREGTAPEQWGDWEDIVFHEADSVGNEPKLEIIWEPYNRAEISGLEWYYWNSSLGEKAAIVLSGAYAFAECVYILSPIVDNFPPYRKYDRFIDGLRNDGFDVLGNPNMMRYTDSLAFPSHIYNATMWLLEQGYRYIYLFGHSGGGVAIAYEILKNCSKILSGSVIASAPVDVNSTYSGPLWHSAPNASQAKVPTSFVVGKNDDNNERLGNITHQMFTYYNNTVVKKEWHLWDGGHEVFPHDSNCSLHSNETILDVALNWFNQNQRELDLTVETYLSTGSEISTDVWIDNGSTLYSPVTVTVGPGLYTVEVSSTYTQDGDVYAFKEWENGSTSNPRTINLLGNQTIKANYTRVTETLRPSASGAYTEWWDYPSAGSNHEKVDEATSDGDSTYVRTDSGWGASPPSHRRDLYNLPATSIPNGSTIHNVTIHMLGRSTSSSYKGMLRIFLRTHGTDYVGSVNYPGTSYTSYSKTYTNNPNTNQPWTIDEINALQVGCYGRSGYKSHPFLDYQYYPIRVTQVHCIIHYTEPGG